MKRTAAALLALLTVAGPAQAMIVSAKVGPLIKETTALIAAKNYQAAAAKVKEAEAVESTSDDAYVINQFKEVIVARATDPAPTPIIPGFMPIITPQLLQP
jgi:hypothetical protein